MDLLSNNKNKESSVETTMEVAIAAYIDKTSFALTNLLSNAKIIDDDEDTQLLILENINLTVLVGMYCSAGLNFTSKSFKEDLEKCGVTTINTLKLHQALKQLSKDAMDYKNTTSSTTSATNSISIDLVNGTPDTNDEEDQTTTPNGSIDGNLPAITIVFGVMEQNKQKDDD